MCVRMRPIYSAKLKLLGPFPLLSNPSISVIHWFNHLRAIVSRWIDLWTTEDCQAGILGASSRALYNILLEITRLALVDVAKEEMARDLASALNSSDSRVRTKEGKVDTSKALDASLVDTHSSGTESGEHDTSSKLGNDVLVDDADIRPIYYKEPMAEVPMTTDNDIFATGQQHTEQLEFNNKGEVDQNAKQCHDTRPLPSKLTDHQITKLSNQSLD
ncbi:hypothetical protein Tco_0479335 [Tanacetum coccineum]